MCIKPTHHPFSLSHFWYRVVFLSLLAQVLGSEKVTTKMHCAYRWSYKSCVEIWGKGLYIFTNKIKVTGLVKTTGGRNAHARILSSSACHCRKISQVHMWTRRRRDQFNGCGCLLVDGRSNAYGIADTDYNTRACRRKSSHIWCTWAHEAIWDSRF